MKVIDNFCGQDNNSRFDVVKFQVSDFPIIQCFVLSVCSQLEDKSFFITDDMDSVLPNLLSDEYGFVYGVMYRGMLVAVQAMDFGNLKPLEFSPRLQKVLTCRSMEIGWAMVESAFRKQGIAQKLTTLLEQDAYQLTNIPLVSTTSHPNNINSLFLFLRNGYTGVELRVHYEVPRLFLVKFLDGEMVHFDATRESIFCSHTQLAEKIAEGYACVAILKHNAGYRYKLICMSDI
jgi:RimJ/RimL family protein N-acetyltransferase